MTSNLKLGVISRTRKENERRLPIHPEHFDRIDADLRADIYPEHGYGEHFGVSDGQLSQLKAGMRSRAMQIIGLTGTYGRRLRAAVIGFGATARGAVTALNAHGIHDIDILTNRGVTAVASPIHSTRIVQFDQDERPGGGSPVSFALSEDGRVPDRFQDVGPLSDGPRPEEHRIDAVVHGESAV
jgi:hypothetical protein